MKLALEGLDLEGVEHGFDFEEDGEEEQRGRMQRRKEGRQMRAVERKVHILFLVLCFFYSPHFLLVGFREHICDPGIHLVKKANDKCCIEFCYQCWTEMEEWKKKMKNRKWKGEEDKKWMGLKDMM